MLNGHNRQEFAKLGALSENCESPHDSSINYPSAEENRGHEPPSQNWGLWSSSDQCQEFRGKICVQFFLIQIQDRITSV